MMSKMKESDGSGVENADRPVPKPRQGTVAWVESHLDKLESDLNNHLEWLSAELDNLKDRIARAESRLDQGDEGSADGVAGDGQSSEIDRSEIPPARASSMGRTEGTPPDYPDSDPTEECDTPQAEDNSTRGENDSVEQSEHADPCQTLVSENERLTQENADLKQKYDALARDALLISAADGLSNSMLKMNRTLERGLAPLGVLNALTSAGDDVGSDIDRFAAIQNSTARFEANTTGYEVRRATGA